MGTEIKPKRAKAGPKKLSPKDMRETAGTKEFGAASENAASVEVSNEERYHLIAQAAYYRAEQRNFAPGHELEDWLGAEAEIEMKFSKLSM